MRIIKRKKAPEASAEANQDESRSESETEENSNETGENLRPKQSDANLTHLINENHPYYRVDINEPLMNPYYNQPGLIYNAQSANFKMPPPPIPPLPSYPSANILIPTAVNHFYTQQQIDYNRLLAQQHYQPRLNDISNNGMITNHNKSLLNQNLDPKEVFGNLPFKNGETALNQSNLTAKHSSYYCLTPASSTTSLQDLNNSHLLMENLNNQLNNNNNSKKLKTVNKNKLNLKPIEEKSNQNVAENGKRKRGRPPKNSVTTATTTQSISTATTTTTNTTTAANKLIKTFINKTTCSSNLQKNKISIQETQSIIETKKELVQTSLIEEHKSPLPNLSWANANELWSKMRQKDLKYKHDYLYLNRHSGIEPQMRAILIDWLIEIAYAYRLHRETLHLSVEYMDRFMTLSKQEMRVDRLQLIGMTSLFLASKVEEIYPPKLKELSSHMENYSNNNEEAISQFELFMLKTLNWEISPVTSNTWLMTYLQIASINYHSYLTGDLDTKIDLTKEHNTHIVMPLNVYKNSSSNPKELTNPKQQQFFLNNYMKCITLLDLCLFDMESMKFNYSILAASAMFHMMLVKNNPHSYQLVSNLVKMCSGYKLNELDSCIKWMCPYADVCKEILTEDKMCQIKQFSNIEQEDCHNIQMYYQNLELLKEAQHRKTPSKFYSNQQILTPPESNRKIQT